MIAPNSLREDIKYLVHIGHKETVEIKEKARDLIYWIGINANLENTVNSYDTFQEFKIQQKDKGPMPHDITTTPMD